MCQLFCIISGFKQLNFTCRKTGLKTSESQLFDMFPGETKENMSALQGNDLTGAIDILLNKGSKGVCEVD